MTKAVGKVNDLQNAAPSEWSRRLADPEFGTRSLNPLEQAFFLPGLSQEGAGITLPGDEDEVASSQAS